MNVRQEQAEQERRGETPGEHYHEVDGADRKDPARNGSDGGGSSRRARVG